MTEKEFRENYSSLIDSITYKRLGQVCGYVICHIALTSGKVFEGRVEFCSRQKGIPLEIKQTAFKTAYEKFTLQSESR